MTLMSEYKLHLCVSCYTEGIKSCSVEKNKYRMIRILKCGDEVTSTHGTVGRPKMCISPTTTVQVFT